MTRRGFLVCALGASGCAASGLGGRAGGPPGGARRAAEIEASVGGRLGLFALDTATGRQVSRRPDERFAMCSTFKWLLGAAVLARADGGGLRLDDHLSFGPADLLAYAPVARQHLAEGFLTVEAAARAAVTLSDNTAANLLLARIGGPAALTAFARAAGDPVTRLDRTEPALNSNLPGDPRDTTSPRAMVGLMARILCGDRLSPARRELLVDWLRRCETGQRRLRAGLPPAWAVGDKTGSGERGAVNDLAMAVPPGRGPILIAAYLSDSAAPAASLERAQAQVGAWVAAELGG